MKNKILIFAAIALALSFCSCTKEEPFVNERYFYTTNSDGAIVSVDVYTGEAQFLCSDPLCTHTADACELVEQAGRGVYQDSRYLFYIRNSVHKEENDIWAYAIWQYDIKTGETKMI